MRNLWLLALLLPSLLWGQNSAHKIDSVTRGYGGATVRLCVENNGNSVPCAQLAPIYNEMELKTKHQNPFLTDANGGYDFYASCGVYQLQICASYIQSPTGCQIFHNYQVPCTTGALLGSISVNGTVISAGSAILTMDGAPL